MSEPNARLPQWIHKYFVPLFLITLCPPTAIIFWYINTALDGSFMTFWHIAREKGIFSFLYEIWKPVFFGSWTAWKILACFAFFELALMRLVPGKPFLGPVTPKGNIPLYKANGFASYIITIFSFVFASFYFQWFSPTILYDNMGPLLGALNVFSLLFCIFLYFKGIFNPSSTDNGRSGFFFFDFYWGTELYPRIFGWDVKQFTNCRIGMMSWALLLLSYGAKQSAIYGLSDSMAIGIALQLIYITKFFLWEPGYLRSLDIMHDRAGFMICWGCLAWLPCIYTSPSLYLVNHPIHLGDALATGIFLAGTASIIVNYLADRQRQVVRAKNGACLVWRRTPKLIEASYITQNGEMKRSLLLASGWWGISRHFHYIPELSAAFFWSLPALFENFMPYFYVVFLSALLLDRAFRHDKRCSEKYGPNWDKYCQEVPYKIIPYVF